jgi:hypothetical protein
VGPEIDYDLCSVFKETAPGGPSLFQLHPVIPPPNVTVSTNEPYSVRLTLQARSIEIDSDPFIVAIAWDGQWSDDDRKMSGHHLVITP